MKLAGSFSACLVTGALFLLVPGSSIAQERCGLCHPEERVIYAESDHAMEDVSCVDCHGGRAGEIEAEAAHRGDFRSLRDRREIPQMCSGCHSDLARMRPYNLPIDQYAVYLTSQHGIAHAAGDLRAAICTDCHGVHDIRSQAESSSMVNPRRIPSTCGSCHADEGLMDSYGLGTELVQDYRSSIHGTALIDEGNAAAPSCTNCHGVHGATPPGVGDVDKVCGACHRQIREIFRHGPHLEAMLEAEIPECASCHSEHGVQRFDVSGIASLCANCHEEGSDQAVLGEKMATLIESASEVVGQAEELVLRAERHALEVEDELGRLEEARTYLREAGPLMHAVSLESVEQVTRRAESIGQEVQSEIYHKLDQRPARIGLALFWFYLLMTLAVLFMYKRSLARLGSSS